MSRFIKRWTLLLKLGAAVAVLCLAFGSWGVSASTEGVNTDPCGWYTFSNNYVVDYWSYYYGGLGCVDSSAWCADACWTQHGISPDSEVQECSLYCNLLAWRACMHGACLTAAGQ